MEEKEKSTLATNISITVSAEKPPTPSQEPFPSQGKETPRRESFSVREKFSVHEVDRIWLDNSLFRASRKTVYRIDNALFNSGEHAIPGYQPTRFALVLPFWGGIIAASYIFFNSFGKYDNDILTRNVLIGGAVMLVINLFLNGGNALLFPDKMRKICYPFFIAVCSAVFYFITLFVCAWAYALIVIVLILVVLAGGLRGGFPGSSGNGESSPPVTEEAYIDDGSVMGVTISRQGGSGDWKGSDGHLYTEDGCGNFRRR